MKITRPRLRTVLIGLAFLASVAAAYRAGYHFGYGAGLNDKGPQHRYLVVNRPPKGNPNSSGADYIYFNVADPRDAARLAEEERRLKSSGADYYVAKGLPETSIRPEPAPRRVKAHR
jgi:hypothetical protein